MKFRTIAMALGALAVRATAQEKIAPEVQQSVLLALAQAIPTDSVSYALASSSAFAAEMASSLSAGNTPSWYQALPSDVKSLLPQIYPQEVEATPTPTPTPTPSSSYYEVSSSSYYEVSSSAVETPYPTGMNSTTVALSMSATGSATSSVTLSPSSSASDSPAFTGAAAKLSSGTVGVAAGAALGFLGMLAL